MVIHKTPWLLKAFYSSLTWTGKASHQDKPCLYLTFDDGPIPSVTPWVADILANYNAGATFFCVGDNIRKHPEEFELIQSQGHRVANHTFHHVNGWSVPTETYLREIKECDKVLRLDQNCQQPLFRPPYGKISRKQISEINNSHRIIMWDVLSADYDHTISPRKCLEATKKAAEPGSIVLFHDSYKAERNLKYVLPAFLDHFAAQGYLFKTL
ncbi:polysaccharide deacetylase family protein [Roseivirga sp. BDSF3-8]|uniref:polysaccharide deacetylase family protein n=1 Tax=Roseivirga sp. BDSF3-8 TaxID=3241598 RepID=UPI0035318262